MNGLELRQILRTHPLVLDGGLATELERAGYVLNDGLWSARILQESPEAIKETHKSFLRSGTQIVTSCSYQATIEGFMSTLDINHSQAAEFIGNSVELARQARDEYVTQATVQDNKPLVLVAAGIGPFGAYLANGSEYTGDYTLSLKELIDFHRERWILLSERKPDLILCETIPQRTELLALAALADAGDIAVAISMNCRNTTHLSDGTPLSECVRLLEQHNVDAVGINCISPDTAVAAARELQRSTDLPIVAYPNSGELFSASTKTWSGESDVEDFRTITQSLYDAGCRIIGGCCRTTPAHIATVAKTLQDLHGPNPQSQPSPHRPCP
jgi:homocysteine S-methyltransferase